MTRFSPLPTVTSRCQPCFGNVFPFPITTLPLGYQISLATEKSAQHFVNIDKIGSVSVAKALRCQPAKTSMISTISTLPPPPKGGGVCLATHTPPTSDWVFHCQAVQMAAVTSRHLGNKRRLPARDKAEVRIERTEAREAGVDHPQLVLTLPQAISCVSIFPVTCDDRGR
mgnify:CR=1 FL=1